MKIKSTHNSRDLDSKEFIQKVSDILEARNSGVEIASMKQKISELLDGDKQKALFLLSKDSGFYEFLPDALKTDSDIVIKLIEIDPQRYNFLSEKLKGNIDIQMATINTIISGKGDVFDLIEVLKIGEKKNKKLLIFVDGLLGKNSGFLRNEIHALLFILFKSERNFYNLIIEKGIISSSHSGISLGAPIAAYLSKIIKELEGQSLEESQQKLYKSLLGYLGIKEKNLGKPGKRLLEILISTISITKKKQENKQEEKEEKKQKIAEIDKPDNKDDVSVGPYNYIPLGNSCRVWDDTGSSISIEKKIFENMSEKSLKNFMNFSKMMKHLGLEFLIIKQHRLSQLVTRVNFYEGEGMSEGRILTFLNSIGKNIGVPEESYEDDEGNKKTGCFKTLGAAKMRFREIKESGNIGNMSVDISNTGDKSVVEIYMKHKGLLVEPYGELSVAKWKK